MLIVRIYEVFLLLCPMCVGQMRLISFVTEGTQTKEDQQDPEAHLCGARPTALAGLW